MPRLPPPTQALPLSIYWANVVTALVAVPFYMVSAPLIGMTWCGRRGAVSGSFFVGGLCLILSTFVEEVALGRRGDTGCSSCMYSSWVFA